MEGRVSQVEAPVADYSMKKLIGAFGVFAALVWMGTAWAGVVIQEDVSDFRPSFPHPILSQRTLMIAGDRAKITDNIGVNETTIDLQAGKTAIIHPHIKDYFDLSFPPETPYPAVVFPKLMPPLLKYKKTGKTSKIAGYKCDIYTGVGDILKINYTVSACYSTDAPGAKEYAAFTKQAAARGGPNLAPEGGFELPDGVPLQMHVYSYDTTRPTPTPQAPVGKASPSPGKEAKSSKEPKSTAKTAPNIAEDTSLTDAFTVTKIEEKTIAAADLTPPAGFLSKRPKILGFH
jgi:hypothetical protein